MSRYMLFLIAIAGNYTNSTQAQQHTLTETQHLEDHSPLMNEVWKTFDLLMYKVTKQNGQTIYTPYFPPKLETLDGKIVELQVYMTSLSSGLKHNTFMLSVLPIHQCVFCGENGIPAMVEVSLSNGKKRWISERPVTIQGKIFLNRHTSNRLEIWITDAAIIKAENQ